MDLYKLPWDAFNVSMVPDFVNFDSLHFCPHGTLFSELIFQPHLMTTKLVKQLGKHLFLSNVIFIINRNAANVS